MPRDRPTIELSPREKQLLQYAAEGYTDTAIANNLGISEATVGTYWGRVRIKLGPYSRTELVAIVLRAEQEVAVESLRRENEYLVRKLEDEAIEGSSYYHDLIENAPDAMIVVSETGTLEFINSRACELFGYERGELEGQNVAILVPPRLSDVHRHHREKYVSDPMRREMGEHLETPAVRKDGSEFLIRATLSAIESPSGLVVVCAIRPIK